MITSLSLLLLLLLEWLVMSCSLLTEFSSFVSLLLFQLLDGSTRCFLLSLFTGEKELCGTALSVEDVSIVTSIGTASGGGELCLLPFLTNR